MLLILFLYVYYVQMIRRFFHNFRVLNRKILAAEQIGYNFVFSSLLVVAKKKIKLAKLFVFIHCFYPNSYFSHIIIICI